MRLAYTALATLVLPTLALAGPLTPPAGPVASTHKTLSQVEPRTPISQATTPGDADSMFRITTPGSYFLTADLMVDASKAGIEVATYGVTIDLAGFSMFGQPGAAYGVRTMFPSSTLTVRNGRINGVIMPVEAQGPALLEDLAIEGADSPIVLQGDGSTVRRCRFFNVTDRIIFVSGDSSVIEDCSADQANAPAGTFPNGIFCTARGLRVRGCTLTGPGGSGTGISVTGGLATDMRALIEHNHIRGFATGIFVSGTSIIRGNAVTDATKGIDVDGGGNFVEGNRLLACGTGIDGSPGSSGDCAVRNYLRSCTSAYANNAGHDFAPAQTAAASTNPNANIVN